MTRTRSYATAALIVLGLVFCLGPILAHGATPQDAGVVASAASSAAPVPIVVPDPASDVGGWVAAVYALFSGKEWLPLFSAIVMGIVYLLRKYVTPAAGTAACWALNLGTACALAVSAAILAGKGLLPALLSGLLAAATAAGALEAVKDVKAGA